jgi:hypothetical protein
MPIHANNKIMEKKGNISTIINTKINITNANISSTKEG